MADGLLPDDPDEIGPYRLEGRLGEGGMGRVFLARTPGGRPVAVKVVHTTLARDGEFRRRFANEVAAARAVGGFHTAQVVDADADADPPWLATAYVAGPSLHSAVATRGPLPRGSVAVLGAGLAEGLAAVHGQGLVHRDLKPGNVLLGADGPRLIDFGIARALDGTALTRTGTALGTLAFMSPEQATAEEAVGFASDVFSLGGVLAFAATGRGPFDAAGAAAVLYRLVHGEPELSGLPEALAAVVSACLAKEPDDRPSPERVLGELSLLADAQATRASWLPPDLTEEIHRKSARTQPRTARTKRMEDDTGPAGERQARRTRRTTAPEGEDSEPAPRRQQRTAASDGTGWLRVGNLTTHRIDAIVDGRSVGAVAKFDAVTVPLAAGRYAVQARKADHGKTSEPPRYLRVAPGSTTRIAFDYSNAESRPTPTDSVAYDHDTRGDTPWPAWVGVAAGLIGGLAAVRPVFLVALSPADIFFGLFLTALAAMGGGMLFSFAYWAIACMLLPKAPNHYTLSLSADGFSFTNDGTELSLPWDDVERIAIVGHKQQARLVVRPRKARTTRSGKRVSGETVLCELHKLGEGAADRLPSALRHFAEARYRS